MIHDELSDSLAKALHVTGAMEQCSCHLLVKRVGMTQAGLVCGEPLKVAVIIFREWAGRAEAEAAVASSSRTDTGCLGRASTLFFHPA